MATMYLAFTTAGIETLKRHVNDRPVNMLVAYPLLKTFMRERKNFNVQKWIMDSGAYSTWSSGKVINLYEYMTVCRSVDAAEVIALDDLTSWRVSKRNTEIMLAAGIPAMPVYHQGEPVEYLDWCCQNAEKIGLGSQVKTKPLWLKSTMAHIWKKFGPTKVHGLGMAGRKAVQVVPFDSVDATSFATAPGRFGQFCGYTGKQIHLKSRMKKGGLQDVWVEVVEHFRRQDYSEAIWKGELDKLVDRTESLYPLPKGVR